MSTSPWHVEAAELPAVDTNGTKNEREDIVEMKLRVAEGLLEAESAAFQKRAAKGRSTEAHWLQSARSSGTTKDKVAAHAVLVEQNVGANLASLDWLLNLAAKKAGARHAAGQAMDALQELFSSSVLLPERKLVAFHDRPLPYVKPGRNADQHLLFWFIEGAVKQRYSRFVDILEQVSVDNLEYMKEKAVRAASVLLAAKPEQEARLLAILVNKLGDPARKVASRSGYLMSALLEKHPRMCAVIVREIESFIFRPQQKSRACYYAVVTLNQLILSHSPAHSGSPLAVKLINIYFTLFQLVLSREAGFAAERLQANAAKRSTPAAKRTRLKKVGGKTLKQLGQVKGSTAAGRHSTKAGGELAEEVDARMLSALITGVRRAFPYAEAGALDDVFQEHSDQLFRTVHLAPLTVATQALMLLFQVMSGQDAVSDRFYTALYATLLRPDVPSSSALPSLLSLLFKSMKADVSTKRCAAFAKRLLQVSAQQDANICCAALLMVSEVLKVKPVLWAGITQAEEAYDDAPEALDVDLSSDASSPRATSADCAPVAWGPSGNGAQCSSRPVQHKCSQRHGNKAHKCATLQQDWNSRDRARKQSIRGPAGDAQGGPMKGRPNQSWPPAGYYDMHKRSPQFALAETAAWWELTLLRDHVHPSVAHMTNTLLAGTNVVYNGDPLQDLSTLAFLDKFVKRRVRRASDRGSSIMQPVQPEGDTARPFSVEFEKLEREDVRAEDVCFYKYFSLEHVKRRRELNRQKRVGKTKRSRAQKTSSSDSDSDEGSAQESDADIDDEDAFMDAEEVDQDVDSDDEMMRNSEGNDGD